MHFIIDVMTQRTRRLKLLLYQWIKGSVLTIGLKKTQWLVTELVIRDWYWVGPNIREIDWVGGWGGPPKVGT